MVLQGLICPALASQGKIPGDRSMRNDTRPEAATNKAAKSLELEAIGKSSSQIGQVEILKLEPNRPLQSRSFGGAECQ